MSDEVTKGPTIGELAASYDLAATAVAEGMEQISGSTGKSFPELYLLLASIGSPIIDRILKECSEALGSTPEARTLAHIIMMGFGWAGTEEYYEVSPDMMLLIKEINDKQDNGLQTPENNA